MQTPNVNQTGQRRQDGGHEDHGPRPGQILSSIEAASLRQRQRSEESWIEVASQPSSSSLSSAADEIITTGLRVQHDSNARRRRRSRGATGGSQMGTGYRASSAGGGSSQEEYEESESESDRVMTSSNEAIRPSPLQQELRRPSRNAYSAASSETMSEREEDDDDDDENATAVNYPRATARHFTPQPNAFSHPPTSQAVRSQTVASHSSRSRPSARPLSQRHSYPANQHSPYNAISPHHQADHDAALRASLSTLLSAAAAVRGLPKPSQAHVGPSNGTSARVEPSSLRLVPEAVALGEEPPTTANPSSASSSPRTSSTSPVADKNKRKAMPPSTTRSNSKDRRAVKKARRTGPLVDEVSPTLLTWVVSAGVVVLVSALSFSAGYVVGREAGHSEVMGQLESVGKEAGRCGKEAASEIGRAGIGLRRLRLSAASGVRV